MALAFFHVATSHHYKLNIHIQLTSKLDAWSWLAKIPFSLYSLASSEMQKNNKIRSIPNFSFFILAAIKFEWSMPDKHVSTHPSPLHNSLKMIFLNRLTVTMGESPCPFYNVTVSFNRFVHNAHASWLIIECLEQRKWHEEGDLLL